MASSNPDADLAACAAGGAAGPVADVHGRGVGPAAARGFAVAPSGAVVAGHALDLELVVPLHGAV